MKERNQTQSDPVQSEPKQLAPVDRNPSGPDAKPNPVDLIKLMKEKAEQHKDVARLDSAGFSRYPFLFQLLAPTDLAAKRRGQDKVETVRRQPLLMMAWNDGTAQWSVSISDKLLGNRITVYSESLDGLLERVERALASGKAEVKETKEAVDKKWTLV